MKMYLSVFVLLAISASAFGAQSQFSEAVRCRVSSINGNFISFLPPHVGDEITIDASQDRLLKLEFSGAAILPVVRPLEKKVHKDTASYVVYFQAEQEDSPNEQSSLTVTIGKFQGQTGKDEYYGQIQSILLEKHAGLVTVADAKLSCQPVR